MRRTGLVKTKPVCPLLPFCSPCAPSCPFAVDTHVSLNDVFRTPGSRHRLRTRVAWAAGIGCPSACSQTGRRHQCNRPAPAHPTTFAPGSISLTRALTKTGVIELISPFAKKGESLNTLQSREGVLTRLHVLSLVTSTRQPPTTGERSREKTSQKDTGVYAPKHLLGHQASPAFAFRLLGR